MEGVVRVEQYDRSTSSAMRQQMRDNPPHILLTNYMMLEYLLVRPADRENIFANHRCRFLVLDEVHTYRGMLGSNIALLVRRLRAHLSRLRQELGNPMSPKRNGSNAFRLWCRWQHRRPLNRFRKRGIPRGSDPIAG